MFTWLKRRLAPHDQLRKSGLVDLDDTHLAQKWTLGVDRRPDGSVVYREWRDASPVASFPHGASVDQLDGTLQDRPTVSGRVLGSAPINTGRAGK
jgi:hypothetical protein